MKLTITLVAAVVLGVPLLVLGAARGLGFEPANPAAYAAPAPRESAADLWRAGAEGCARAGGTWWQGTEAGVVVGRCRPWLPILGVEPLPATSRMSDVQAQGARLETAAAPTRTTTARPAALGSDNERAGAGARRPR